MKKLKRPPPTTMTLVPASDGSRLAREVYIGTALAKRAMAFAKNYKLNYHCASQDECAITYVFYTADEVERSRQQRRDEIAHNKQFSLRQRRWLKTGRATCLGMAVYPWPRKPIRDADEAAHLMALTDDDQVGWLAYADRLDEYGESPKLAEDIRLWVTTGKNAEDKARKAARDAETMLMPRVGPLYRDETPETLEAQSRRSVLVEKNNRSYHLTCPSEWTDDEVDRGTQAYIRWHARRG